MTLTSMLLKNTTTTLWKGPYDPPAQQYDDDKPSKQYDDDKQYNKYDHDKQYKKYDDDKQHKQYDDDKQYEKNDDDKPYRKYDHDNPYDEDQPYGQQRRYDYTGHMPKSKGEVTMAQAVLQIRSYPGGGTHSEWRLS